MKVLVTTPLLSKSGGVAQYLRLVRPHLRAETDYFTVGARSDAEGPLRTLLRLLSDWWRFGMALRQTAYDVVQLNPSLGAKALVRDGAFLLIAKAFGRGVVVFVHGWDAGFARKLQRFRALFRSVFGHADAFIVLSRDFEAGLRSLGYAKAVFVHRAPVDDELLEEPLAGDATDERRFNILFLARVEKEKGIYEALEAYSILKKRHPSVSLTVAGDGSELAGARRFAARRGLTGIEFLGRVEGRARLEAFRKADAYLFPSHAEGLPLSVLEAMACGLPVVARAVGGLRDFFQNGLMGFMTESRDPAILASLLSELISQPALRSSIQLFNRSYARDHFAAARIAAGLDHVLAFVDGGADRTLLRQRRSVNA